MHVLSLHPGKEIRCEECSHPCPSYNYYKLHRNMFHFKSSTVAFPHLSLGGSQPSLPSSGSLAPLLVASQERAHQLSSISPHHPLLGAATTANILPPHLSPIKAPSVDHDIVASSDLNASFCSDTVSYTHLTLPTKA